MTEDDPNLAVTQSQFSEVSHQNELSTFAKITDETRADQAFLRMSVDIIPRRSYTNIPAALYTIQEDFQKMGESIDRLSPSRISSPGEISPCQFVSSANVSFIPGPIPLKRLSQETPKVAEPTSPLSTRGIPPPVPPKPDWYAAGLRAQKVRKILKELEGLLQV